MVNLGVSREGRWKRWASPGPFQRLCHFSRGHAFVSADHRILRCGSFLNNGRPHSHRAASPSPSDVPGKLRSEPSSAAKSRTVRDPSTILVHRRFVAHRGDTA
ncbi:hypothetical protein GCM10009536_05390 [Streptomyces thermocarboxydus]